MRFKAKVTALILIISLVSSGIISSSANAASLSQVLVRFDRMKINTNTTGTVCAKPATTATEASIQVTFPSGYTLGAAAAFTVNTTNLSWPTGGTAWPGVSTASNVTGQVVTFASNDLTVGTLYCFNWVNASAVTVKSTASASNSGSITTRDSVPATIDSSSFSTASIADDQIIVSATIPQTFTFALSGNTDPLGNLSSGAISTSPTPRTVTMNTNAANGWTVWARDLNAGLTSSAASKTINATTGTLVAGTEGYNTGITSSQAGGTGTITIVSAFQGTVTGKGGALTTTLQPVASSNGTASNAVLTLTNNAAISGTTPAATDYTDTLTVVGAGLF